MKRLITPENLEGLSTWKFEAEWERFMKVSEQYKSKLGEPSEFITALFSVIMGTQNISAEVIVEGLWDIRQKAWDLGLALKLADKGFPISIETVCFQEDDVYYLDLYIVPSLYNGPWWPRDKMNQLAQYIKDNISWVNKVYVMARMPKEEAMWGRYEKADPD